MSKAIALKINGNSFLAETDNSVQITSLREIEPAGDFEEVVNLDDVERNFSDVKRLIVECCNSLHEAIAEIPNPEKVTVEFGVKLAGEAGFPMLTKASGEANFKINIEWKTAIPSTHDG
jgi:hypothetical protein